MIHILEHETAPWAALRIARSRRCFGGPILGDAGLNVTMPAHPKGSFYPSQAEHKGAVLTFEWDGPVRQEHCGNGYHVDILFDQHPHRGFVPVGSTRHLKLVNITLQNGSSWEMAVVKPTLGDGTGVLEWLVSKFPGWLEREALRIEREVAQILAEQPSMSVVFPPECTYKSYLVKKFPGVAWPN